MCIRDSINAEYGGKSTPPLMKRFFCPTWSTVVLQPRLIYHLSKHYSVQNERKQILFSKIVRAMDTHSFNATHDTCSDDIASFFDGIHNESSGLGALMDFRKHLISKHSNTLPHSILVEKFKKWFNLSNLHLVQVTSDSSESLINTVMENESVHPIQPHLPGIYSQEQITNFVNVRLSSPNKRCYALVHEQEKLVPLVFINCSFHDTLIGNIKDIFSISQLSPLNAKAVLFYSINSDKSMKGLHLGRDLIYFVKQKISLDFANVSLFSTLSPVPSFASWATKYHSVPGESLDAKDKTKLVSLCAQYLVVEKHEKRVRECPDPVGNFHLGNGAQLERINWEADTSALRMKESLGLMVNYKYPQSKEQTLTNQEKYKHGTVAISEETRLVGNLPQNFVV
eukprot:TRINITY_DN6329_c0_g1_i1.p1 TRINITY_DN6329_c0_g1~~TRINITY_DN6329_c0_g1_i1.p1  ORF type:complete len:397 (-),score=21.48 TRINITY_DN6329_c0_g1_i1:60-1250(-)